MTRSLWKSPFTLRKKPELYSNLPIPRNLELTPTLLNATIRIHNGLKYTEIKVSGEMFGRKAGEFAFTRADYKFKKKKEKSRGSKRKS